MTIIGVDLKVTNNNEKPITELVTVNTNNR